MLLGLPGRLANDARALPHPLVSKKSDQREYSQQPGSGSLGCPLRPMPLRLEPQTLTYFLKSRFHLPPTHKPRDDLCWVNIRIGAQQSLGFELFLRLTDQNPP